MSAGQDRGFALLIVLWSMVLLALLGTGIAATGRTDAQLAANLRAAAAAVAAADGAVHQAVFHLLDPTRPWPADGVPRELRVADARVVLRIEDEGGKVNPNLAPPELLAALLRRVGADGGAADEIATRLVQWRSAPEPSEPPGVRVAPYRQAGLPYGPPGEPFRSLDELGAVPGVTPPLLVRLLPHLSVLTDAAPDPVVAGPVVRQALRDAGQRPAANERRPPRTVGITAEVAGDLGGRFVRHAVVRLGTGSKEAPFRVLAWDAPGG